MTTFIAGKKYRWQKPRSDNEQILDLIHGLSLSRPIAEVLVNRGFTTKEKVTAFLASDPETLVHDASALKDATIAVERIIRAIERKEKILIFGDYDVDGITSTSLMLIGLLPLGASINYFLPNRARDGYGLSVKAVDRAAANKYSLIITVDNGITAFDAADAARKHGIDLIITDHHQPHGELPDAYAIVNPQQKDCQYPFKTFAGVGVIFKLIDLLYKKINKPLPEKMYELLMLGTVADVVPLTGENRYWVQQGLARVNTKQSLAMKKLAENAQLNKPVWGSLDVGFMIAPQLNALGRLDDARDGVKFLVSPRADEVDAVGSVLKVINEERKRIDRAIFDQVDGTIQKGVIDLKSERIIMAAHHGWPAGVIGLVAGKLMHNYGRPAILLHLTKDGIAKGSCRSIEAFNIFEALTKCEDLLLTFGGHKCAAGLSIKEENIPAFKARLEALIEPICSFDMLQPTLQIDAEIHLSDLTKKCMADLTLLEPFGNQNALPLFVTGPVTQLKSPTLLKDQHVKTTLFADGIIKPVIFFNRPDLYQMLLEIEDRSLLVVGHATTNVWNDKTTIEMQGLDIALL
jgi:single-stranded-DNA-specific exonuclease